MENIFSKVEELTSSIKDYVNIRIEEVQFEMAEKTSDLLSYLIAGTFLFIVFLLAFLFLSIASAFALNDWIGNSWIGFLMIAIVDLLIGFVVWKEKKTESLNFLS